MSYRCLYRSTYHLRATHTPLLSVTTRTAFYTHIHTHTAAAHHTARAPPSCPPTARYRLRAAGGRLRTIAPTTTTTSLTAHLCCARTTHAPHGTASHYPPPARFCRSGGRAAALHAPRTIDNAQCRTHRRRVKSRLRRLSINAWTARTTRGLAARARAACVRRACAAPSSAFAF